MTPPDRIDPQREIGGIVRAIYGCFFLSGAVGLVYEILWLRKLLLVFGSTVHAVSTVLTVFFGGLALGSWVFGRLADRYEGGGLRWYAWLEGGIGLYAFVTLPLFDAIQRIYIPVYRASEFSPAVLVGASFVCSALILLFPTTLMGGTFPLLSRFLIRTVQERGMKIASLYGLNTLGAMTGTLFVYFVGLPMIGLFRTLMYAGVLNLGICLLALVFDQHLTSLGFRLGPSTVPSEAPTPVSSPVQETREVRWVFAAFGLSGFSAMVYEVTWTRALSLVLGSSIYAFCLMLATFLGGIAIGSLIARRDLRRDSATLWQFLLVEVCLAIYGLASLGLFNLLPEWFVTLWPLFGGSFAGLSALQGIMCAFAMLFPTVLMGYLFPIVSDLVTTRFAQLGQRLGSAYAVNTVGGILGSFLSGFFLVPRLGLAWTIVVAAFVNLVAALVIFVRFSERALMRRLAIATASMILWVLLSGEVFVPLWQRQVLAAGVYLDPMAFRVGSVGQRAAQQDQLLFYRDSLNATVSVHRRGEHIFLKVGGKTDASTGVDMVTQVLSAHIPLLMHRNAQKVLVIGLGSGVTLGSAGRYPVSVLDCAEIDPAVVEGARYFGVQNHAIHDDPRARIVAADGRNFLLATTTQYDIIISEPSNPWMAGLAYLFTREFYELARSRLAPGGIMCQWLQLYRIFPEDVKLILRTFHDAFPYVSVWSTIPGDLLIVGSFEPHRMDAERLKAQFAVPAIREDLAQARMTHPAALLQLFKFGEQELEQLTADVRWLHRDDQPWLEFTAPKALYHGPSVEVNYSGLERWIAPRESIVVGELPTPEEASFYLDLATLSEFRLEPEEAVKALEEAVRLDPTSAESYRRLGRAYGQRSNFLLAHEMLSRAIELDPKNPEGYKFLARLLWQSRKYGEAQAAYEHMVRLELPNSQLAEEIGNCFREDKRWLQAAEYYRSAWSQGGGDRPGLAQAFVEALRELGSHVEAEQALRSVVARYPKDAVFALQLGEVLLDQGRAGEAQPYFQQAAVLAPKTAAAYIGLGRVALAQGRREEARRWLTRGLRYDAYHQEALQLLHSLQEQPVS